MRRVALALFSTVTGLVMLLSFKTHSSTATVPVATAPVVPAGTSAGDSASSTGGTSSTGTASAPSSAASSAAASGTKTVTGDAVDTRFGPVQVQITVTNGTITAVNAVEYPQNNPRDQQINAYAIPQLNSEALAAKSANIDMVSGATYTSDGYLDSLQSALDKAGL
ncbi:FMN-binding protein [Jatrophihabitans sp.]|uniref:FMN-binding protein n=1 Tax=Jatrophihabitans sp. TaxID=1932789 RepID=UPI002CD591F9|nr:FMN-binding protein [Jatrophihabitans sp.]